MVQVNSFAQKVRFNGTIISTSNAKEREEFLEKCPVNDVTAFSDAIIKFKKDIPQKDILKITHFNKAEYIPGDNSKKLGLEKAKLKYTEKISEITSFINGIFSSYSNALEYQRSDAALQINCLIEEILTGDIDELKLYLRGYDSKDIENFAKQINAFKEEMPTKDKLKIEFKKDYSRYESTRLPIKSFVRILSFLEQIHSVDDGYIFDIKYEPADYSKKLKLTKRELASHSINDITSFISTRIDDYSKAVEHEMSDEVVDKNNAIANCEKVLNRSEYR